MNNFSEYLVKQIHVDRVIELAVKAQDVDEFPVGAVVLQNGMVIGEGFNQKESLNDPTAHAEILALKSAAAYIGDWRLINCTLITSLEPCPMCLGAIIQARVSHIVYLAKDLRWGACGTVMDFSAHPSINHHCTTEYVPYEEVVGMMTQFFKQRRS